MGAMTKNVNLALAVLQTSQWRGTSLYHPETLVTPQHHPGDEFYQKILGGNDNLGHF